MSYKKINNIVGWVVFAIASYVYLTTMEPTGSFWDCGEFIACCNGLQVGHPPGAPMFMLMGRMFILFAGENVKQIPLAINALSAICSALCILFLFWSITHLARKMVVKGKNEPNMGDIIAIMGSGFVGAIAYTFTDSFWFSAVEGEVYATSAMFTAVVFWAMLKWEEVADEKHNARWIIFIAFMMGLSIGVHLLNLLAIPALALIYYFKRYKFTWVGFVAALGVSIAILGFVQKGIISYFIKIGAQFDLIFVNSFGLPFWSGFMFYLLVTLGIIAYALWYTTRKGKVVLNTALLAVTFILIGYSSYSVIVIRSTANPPLDENDPENVFSLLNYLGREQYGDFPLAYGQYYNAKTIDSDFKDMQYVKKDGKYVEVGRKESPVYDPAFCGIFPRMWSPQDNHASFYKNYHKGNAEERPTSGENISFFIDYQVMHMYFRYFMWNFVGRQNDIQSYSDNITKGNWISGITPIDNMRLGPQEKLPQSMTNNKGRNKFYFLPLILGLVGFAYQVQKNRKDFVIVGMLFFMTGMAIVLYVNQPPYQPRERDYAYAGSFYAFSMWIGLGVLAIFDLLRNKLSLPTAGAAIAATVVSCSVPYVLCADGWNDHNRALRYTSRDFATNYLNSCAPNAIIFTNGDNDTFPLWYAQQVEGVRRDIRIVNLSLLNTDWYVNQMKRQEYNSPPVPFTLTYDKYMQGTRDYVPFVEQKSLSANYTELKQVFNFMTSENPETKVQVRDGKYINYLPTKKLRITVDKAAVIRSGTIDIKDTAKIVDYIDWDINKSYVMKADLMMLDLLAHNDWKRPVYYAVTVGSDNYIGLDDYFQLEGLAYRFVPIKTKNADQQTGRVATDLMYKNMMDKFVWGNMKNEKVYLDQNNLNMTMNFRNNFARLSESLLNEGKSTQSVAVLDKCNEEMPDKTVPYNMMMLRITEMYYRNAMQAATSVDSTGRPIIDPEKMSQSQKGILEKGNSILRRLAVIYEDDLNYYFSLRGTKYFAFIEKDMNQSMAIMNEMVRLSKLTNQPAIIKEMEDAYGNVMKKYQGN